MKNPFKRKADPVAEVIELEEQRLKCIIEDKFTSDEERSAAISRLSELYEMRRKSYDAEKAKKDGRIKVPWDTIIKVAAWVGTTIVIYQFDKTGTGYGLKLTNSTKDHILK